MSDYYSYAPLLTLDRPLTLVGIAGADVGRTARAMNLLSGLPFVWIDRQVEHRLGRAVELVQLEEGAATRHEQERLVVTDALKKPTHPILAASAVTFEDVDLRERLEAETELVLLHLDVESALARVRSQNAKDARRHYAITEGGAAPDEVVRARLVAAERRLRHVARVVLVRDRPPLAVAQELCEALGLPR